MHLCTQFEKYCANWSSRCCESRQSGRCIRLGSKARKAFSNKRSLRMRNVKLRSLFNISYGLLFDLGLLCSHLVPGFPISPLMSCVVDKGV